MSRTSIFREDPVMNGTKCHVNVMEVNYLGKPNKLFSRRAPVEKQRKSVLKLSYTEKCKHVGGLHLLPEVVYNK
jgi:hypothetical protein